MPLFSRFKNKGSQPAGKGRTVPDHGNGNLMAPAKPKWQSQWNSKEIVPEEVAELVHACTVEMRSRAEALDAPFLLLPFRPTSDPQGARTFIRNFFKSNAEGSSQYRGSDLQQELRLTEAIVLCSILKWCWSRMPNGVVTWPVYEGFQMGEKDAHMARNAFRTFIPISSDSEARTSIIFDFFDLMAAVAAHGKRNGLGGTKLSRLAGWWAFEHSDDGKGFEGGYKSWRAAADASSHLFFAYLRSLSPDTDPSLTVIERIPRSLQALLASTEYPPEVPVLLQRTTYRVVMLVDTVSPTPFALLRRAKHFEYKESDRVLRHFQELDDPLDALTDECKRVLYAVSQTNNTASKSRHGGNAQSDEAWSAFSNLGFSDIDERALSDKTSSNLNGGRNPTGSGMWSEPRSRDDDGNRPTTPSWADFLSSGFADDGTNKSPTLLYPPAHVLPPLGSRVHSPSPMSLAGDNEDLTPGELAAITNVELDDAFWWVWMTSLASEEPVSRKAVFGRCALIETNIMNGQWLIMEEQVKGASPDPTEGAVVVQKKGIFSFTKRGRLSRRKSTNQPRLAQDNMGGVLSATPSRTSIAPDQHAKIKAAAAALVRKQPTPDAETVSRRGRHDEPLTTKTNSMLTLGLQSEAAPAMQWTNAYDKNTIRAQYLGDASAGKGKSREDFHTESLANNRDSVAPADSASMKALPVISAESANRALPPPPIEDFTTAGTDQPDHSEIIDQPHPTNTVHPPEHTEIFHQSPQEEETALPPAPASVVKPVPEAVPIPTYTQPATVPGSTLPDALEKEMAVEPSSPRSDRHRKPVPAAEHAQDHPAYRRQVAPVSNTKPVTPANPAALAAARAMQATAKPASPEYKTNQPRLKKQSGGTLKKLFGRKKDNTSARGDSLEVARPVANVAVPTSDSGVGRRISMMRKKPEGASATSEQAAFAAPIPSAHAPAPVDESLVPTHQSPPDVPSYAAGRRSDLSEHEHAVREFSRFDQGPVEDMPAVMPQFDDDDEEAAEVHEREPERDFQTAAAKRLAPHAATEFEHDQFVTPMEREVPIMDDQASEATMEDNHDVGVTHDRWATIRENAAKRAARASEEQSTQSRPSQSQRTDDGETSGEETIESRVARIKARVAELTGNIDVNR